MIRKILFLFNVLIIGFAVGYGVVFAYAIPGWDRPYDPPDYYDPVNISWEDTNKPTYFYRDLGWHGGTVYDSTRHIKSVLFSGQFGEWLTAVLKKLNITIANTTPMDGAILHQTQTDIADFQAQSVDLNRSSDGLSFLNSTLFRSPDRYDDDTNSYDKNQQMEKLQQTYTTFAQSAQNAVANRGEEQQTLNNIIDSANSAEGDLQIDQANTQLEAMHQAELGRRNSLLANIAALEAVQHKVEMDENLAYYRQAEAAKIYVSDPYNQTERDKQTYTKPEPKGFVDFNLTREKSATS